MDRESLTPKYHWIAHLLNGVIIYQIQPDGSCLPSSVLSRFKVSALFIVGLREPIRINIPTDANIRVFNKVRMHIGPQGPSIDRRYFFGYNESKSGDFFISIRESTGGIQYHRTGIPNKVSTTQLKFAQP
jgi:hypothetical protein